MGHGIMFLETFTRKIITSAEISLTISISLQLYLIFKISLCELNLFNLVLYIAVLHLGGREGAFAPLGYVVCIATYIILKRFMNHMMRHHSYLIKIKFLH